MSADLAGQLQSTLGKTYTIERELGGGGMSRVFTAVETALGRRVVIKVLAPDLAAGVSVQRFAREIRLAASLQQANIVPVLSAGDTNGIPYYAMPFVEGLSLRERLSRDGRLPIASAISDLFEGRPTSGPYPLPTFEQMKALSVPTLFIYGEWEAPGPRRIADSMARWMPNALRVVIPGGGHGVHFAEADRFNRALRDFLRSLPAPSRR